MRGPCLSTGRLCRARAAAGAVKEGVLGAARQPAGHLRLEACLKGPAGAALQPLATPARKRPTAQKTMGFVTLEPISSLSLADFTAPPRLPSLLWVQHDQHQHTCTACSASPYLSAPRSTTPHAAHTAAARTKQTNVEGPPACLCPFLAAFAGPQPPASSSLCMPHDSLKQLQISSHFDTAFTGSPPLHLCSFPGSPRSPLHAFLLRLA